MSRFWQEVERIFHEALTRPTEERQAFLESSCGTDHDLLCEVTSLLQHHGEPTQRLATSVQPVAASLLESSRADNIAAATMFGPYQVDRKLGDGGMGAVYLATDTRLGRKVAIKLASGAVAHTAAARARFLREAQSAAALAHPNIAIVHDFGETAGRPWLVMEYVAGTSLRSRIGAGAVSEKVWMDYATQIASALEHAHARRIVHRDVKPENIMLSEDGVVKLVDFGIATVLSDDPRVEQITETGVFVGTLAYTAPELYCGEQASTRTDVYSCGVVLWELAYGRHPFATLSGPALVGAIVAGQHSGGVPEVDLSPGIKSFIQRCMSRAPSDRYPDGASLSAALRTIRTGGLIAPVSARSPSVAVLDFANIAGSSEVDWLGTGIAETLSADLAKMKSATVAQRGRIQQAVRRAGDPEHDPAAAAALGRELAVDWIIAGAFQQIGNRIRLTAKIIETATGDVIAFEKTDGVRDDLFDLQDRIAAASINTLSLRLGTDSTGTTPAPKPPSLAAYEHYVRGRRQMYQMQGHTLNEAIEHFKQAVALDPGYALAYSALGTAHMLRFPITTNPDDVARASECLEHAIKLDPELGEPYPWLCNIRFRQSNPEGAFAAGLKGIQLQPDLPEAHYFYGGGQYLCAEHPTADQHKGLDSLTEALRVQPKFHPAWIGAGATSIFLGKYESAIQFLSEAIRLEPEPDLLYRFVGADSLCGIAYMRMSQWQTATRYHTEALQKLSNSSHIYSDAFRILSACGLGDIELRSGSATVAAAHYRRAWQIAKEKPRIIGSQRLQIRAGAGLVAAYACAGEQERALELMAEIRPWLDTAAAQTATATLECGLAQLCIDLAVAEVQLGRLEEASKLLARARKVGWKDVAWLRSDPLFKPIHSDPVFRSWVGPLSSEAS